MKITTKLRNWIVSEFKEPASTYWRIGLDNRSFVAPRSFARHIVKGYEPQTTAFLLSNLHHTDIFVDVGACYGYYSFLAERRCLATIAIEPNSEAFRLLKYNCRESECIRVAIGDREGTTDIYIGQTADMSSINPNTAIERIETVNISTLDEILDYLPTVIKIDVEGYEIEVLTGAREALSNCRIVIVEYVPSLGVDIERLRSFFEGWRMIGADSNLIFTR